MLSLVAKIAVSVRAHVVSAAVILFASTSSAAIYVVTNTGDSGAGSLRQAILDANASGAPGGIVLGANTITFTPALSGTVTLQSALPLIFHNLTIDGTGASITIDGQNLHRGFFISGLPLPSTPQSMTPQPIAVSLINLTLANCRAMGGSAQLIAGGGMGAGGAIFVNENAAVMLSGITLSSNAARGGNGGLLFHSGYDGDGGGGMGAGGAQGTISFVLAGGGGGLAPLAIAINAVLAGSGGVGLGGGNGPGFFGGG
ncbi:MAG: hypothetical protein ACXVJT_18425, partial [Thermoanaerobaculia bacterium]